MKTQEQTIQDEVSYNDFSTYKRECVDGWEYLRLVRCRLATFEGLLIAEEEYRPKINYLQNNVDKCSFELLDALQCEIRNLFNGSIIRAISAENIVGLTHINIEDLDTRESYCICFDGIASDDDDRDFVVYASQVPSLFWLFQTHWLLECDKKGEVGIAELEAQISELHSTTIEGVTAISKNIVGQKLSREGVKWLFSSLRKEKAIGDVSDTQLASAVSSITGYSAEKLRQNMQNADLTDDTRIKLKAMLSKLLGDLD